MLFTICSTLDSYALYTLVHYVYSCTLCIFLYTMYTHILHTRSHCTLHHTPVSFVPQPVWCNRLALDCCSFKYSFTLTTLLAGVWLGEDRKGIFMLYKDACTIHPPAKNWFEWVIAVIHCQFAISNFRDSARGLVESYQTFFFGFRFSFFFPPFTRLESHFFQHVGLFDGRCAGVGIMASFEASVIGRLKSFACSAVQPSRWVTQTLPERERTYLFVHMDTLQYMNVCLRQIKVKVGPIS